MSWCNSDFLGYNGVCVAGIAGDSSVCGCWTGGINCRYIALQKRDWSVLSSWRQFSSVVMRLPSQFFTGADWMHRFLRDWCSRLKTRLILFFAAESGFGLFHANFSLSSAIDPSHRWFSWWIYISLPLSWTSHCCWMIWHVSSDIHYFLRERQEPPRTIVAVL